MKKLPSIHLIHCNILNEKRHYINTHIRRLVPLAVPPTKRSRRTRALANSRSELDKTFRQCAGFLKGQTSLEAWKAPVCLCRCLLHRYFSADTQRYTCGHRREPRCTCEHTFYPIHIQDYLCKTNHKPSSLKGVPCPAAPRALVQPRRSGGRRALAVTPSQLRCCNSSHASRRASPSSAGGRREQGAEGFLSAR